MDETDDATAGPADGGDVAPAFRLGYVPGVTPGKWARTWSDRRPDLPLVLVPVPADDAADLLRGDALDAAFLRLPAERDGLHVIPLYEEVAVVVVGQDHLLAALETTEHVPLDDLADEVLLQPADDALDWPEGVVPGLRPLEQPPTTGLAVELVAAGIGVLVVPQSLARLHHRKDLTYRLLDGAPSAPVALAWPVDSSNDDVDDLVGIVRGRTANSSRGRRAEREEPAPSAKPSSDKRKPGAPGSGTGRGAARGRGGKPGGGKHGGGRPGGSRRRPR